MRSKRRSGFTLIEIMIVVVILAILAATIIPQFSTSVNDSKVATMQSNLHTLRVQIQLYSLQHGGLFPTITSSTLPQMTGNTNVNGNLGTRRRLYLRPLRPNADSRQSDRRQQHRYRHGRLPADRGHQRRRLALRRRDRPNRRQRHGYLNN